MDVVFVRHGRAKLNDSGCFFGSTDCDITEEGAWQSTELRGILGGVAFDGVYVSPLKRAIQTAEAIEIDYKVDPRLCEMNFGVFEGLSYAEIEERYPMYLSRWNENYFDYRIPEGESLEEVFARVEDFIKDISGKHERVLVVTHGGVIRCALSLAMESREHFYRFEVRHGSISVISYEEGFCFIKALNHGGTIFDM